jgi:hypothetical protein
VTLYDVGNDGGKKGGGASPTVKSERVPEAKTVLLVSVPANAVMVTEYVPPSVSPSKLAEVLASKDVLPPDPVNTAR